jgi:hypothetical protein
MKKVNFNFDVQKIQDLLKNLQDSAVSFDWRSLQKLTNPQAADDLNVFLEKLPQTAGQTMLIIAGVAWATAGAVGLFTAVQLQKMAEIRIELEEAQALQPIVPQIVDKAVSPAKVKEFVESTTKIYPGLELKASGPTIVMNARTLASFGQFREAIAHVQNGGSGWRVSIDRLCVGRECERYPLGAALKINTVSVKKAG